MVVARFTTAEVSVTVRMVAVLSTAKIGFVVAHFTTAIVGVGGER